MYLNKLKKPNGDIYLSIREKYHVPKKGARERTVESIGYNRGQSGRTAAVDI